MPVTIGKRFKFDAAHRLPLHEGKCRRPHGHTYILEVDVEGPVQIARHSSQGMVLDYEELKKIVEAEILSKWDHYNLNEVMRMGPMQPEEENVTTAERLAQYCATVLGDRLLEKGVAVTRVRLQETPDTWAEWRP